MPRLQNFFRLSRIFRILREHGLHEIVHVLKPDNFIVRFFSTKTQPHETPLGPRLRMALEDLGPIFVKFGQALSTRPDLLAPDIAAELAKLQDKVPPFPTEEARRVIENAFKKPISEIFKHFDNNPLASASIAQVHLARLHDDTEVVVKVLRPGVGNQIEEDLGVLRTIADLAHRYWSDGRRFKPRDVVADYSRIIRDELDFLREAANASQLKRNWENSNIIEHPEIYWDYCHADVMVMERMHGVPISDIETLTAKNVNLKILAEHGVEIFFTQVFKHNFFHADMHPGNIFVNTDDPQNNPKYVSIDFGIVGSLDPSDQSYIAANLLAFFNRDYRRVAQLHVDSGWVPDGTRVDEFESAIRTVCEPIFDKPLKDISFGQFLVRLFSTARRFNMEVQPQLVLLQKTLLNIEGLGRQLYPQLDLWETAKPFLEDWMTEKSSGKQIVGRWREALPELASSLQNTPQIVAQVLQHAAQGKLNVSLDKSSQQQLIQQQRHADRSSAFAIAGAGFLVSSSLLAGMQFNPIWVIVIGVLAGLTCLYKSLTGRP